MTLGDVRPVVDYHYWARDRMFEALAQLTPDQFTRDLSSSFPSIRDTVVHLYTADRRRLLHLVNHASYHRGQVTTMLRQLGIDVPRSQDMIMFYKERGL